MAAPLLFISTTSSPGQEIVPIDPTPVAALPPHPTTTTRGHAHHQDGRRSAPGVGGRPGKKGSSKAPAPKKPVQRGPGVAQLEYLRHQEQLRKLAEMSHRGGDWSSHTELLGAVPQLPLGGIPVHYCVAPPTPVVYPGQMVGVGRAIDVQRSCGFTYGSDRAVGGFYMPGVVGSAAGALEPPSELSSMPNPRCFPEHCDICMKQKNEMISARNNVVVFDHGAADHTINSRQRPAVNSTVPDFLELNLGNGFSCGRKSGSTQGSYGLHGGSRQPTYQDVQMMNSVGGGGRDERSRRLMEYEFFPGKSNSSRSTFPKSLSFPSTEHHQQRAASTAAAMSASSSANPSASAFAAMRNRPISAAAEASRSNPNSIDLSLRLSY